MNSICFEKHFVSFDYHSCKVRDFTEIFHYIWHLSLDSGKPFCQQFEELKIEK